MRKIIIICLCIIFMGITASFGNIWVSEDALDEFIQNSSVRSIELLKTQPDKAAKEIRFSVRIPKESYKRGEVLEVECTFENTSKNSLYYRSGEDSISFVAMCDNEVIMHLSIFICRKCLGTQEFKPKDKLRQTLLINTERFWQNYYKNEKGSIIPTYHDNKRIPVAMFFGSEGFWRDKDSNRLVAKSNVLQFEVVE